MDIKSMIDESTKALNAKDVDKFASYQDANGDYWQPGVPGSKLADQLESLKRILDAFPDAQFKVNSLVVEGDKAAFEAVLEGTHTKTLKPPPGMPEVPATGKRIKLNNAVHCEAKNGKFVKSHTYLDRLSMMEQLGVVPQPEAALKA